MKGNTPASIDMPGMEWRKDFPRFNGYVMALEYVPKNKRKAYEDAIREWCKTHEKRMWPDWIVQWPDTKKRLEAAGK
jgi:hypothetical protein